jgi:hypothetical protein
LVIEELERRLGVGEEVEGLVPWTQGRPVVRGVIGIAQPGLSAADLGAQLAVDPLPDGPKLCVSSAAC